MDGILITLVFSAFTIALIFIRELFLWLRRKIPKRVQCWFCHTKTQVDYSLSNSWFCGSCDQYNGFKKDGDYNRIIDSQYEEKLNFSISSIGRTKDAWKSINRLCEKCNRNQELKVQQLASFVPLNDKNYDVEIEHYRAQLEKSYKLCTNCEGLLSKIFTNEKNLFSIPRRLVTSLIVKPEVTGIARCILYMNLLVSLIVSVSAYINLEGVPPFVQPYLTKYHDLHKVLWIFKPVYLLFAGLILNILGWIKTRSSGLMLNSLSWLLVLLLTVYPKNGYKHYIIALQAISGIISCAVSIISLTSNKRRRSSEKSKQHLYNGKKFNVSQPFTTNFSTSESSPAYVSSTYDEQVPNLSQKVHRINTNNSTKSPPLSPQKTSTPTTPISTTIIKPQKNWSESINNGIRGLNLGNGGGNGFNRNVTQRRMADTTTTTAGNLGDAWWMKQKRMMQRNNHGQNVFNNVGGVRPPSTSSSGFSDMAEDIVDDCASCTGHSPVCRHNACHYTPPSPQEYNCYYAAAYFQRLLYSAPLTPPSPKFTTNLQQQQPIHDPVPYIYIIPIIALITSNIALLWTVYNREGIK